MIVFNTSNYTMNYSIIDNPILTYYEHGCHEEQTDAVQGLIGYTIMPIALIGIFGNIFVIILALKYTERKNLHHLIINMAVSDALYLFVMLMDVLLSNNMGIIICKTLTFVQHTSCRVSLVTLFVISVERFRATRNTLQRSRPYTMKQRVTIIGMSWLFPMAMAASYTYFLELDPLFCYAIIMGTEEGWDDLVVTTVTVILCCGIFFLSIVSIRRLSRTHAIHAHMSEDQRNMRTQRARAAVRMVLVSVVLYVLCWLPNYLFHTIFLMSTATESDKFIHFKPYETDDSNFCTTTVILVFALTFLPIVNSSISPFIYIILLRDFREAAKKVLCRRETLNQAQNRRGSHELQPIPNPEIEPERRGNQNRSRSLTNSKPNNR